MLGKVICLKYLDPGSPVVDVHINGTIFQHTLIDLGAAINVMTKDTMLNLNLQGSFRKTTTVLQLADRSIVTPKGIVEDVMLVLYPPAQPSLVHDLPLWLEEEEEDEIYSTQLYILEATIGGGHPDEDDLIEHLLQSLTPSSLPLEEEVRETQNNHPIDLCLANSNPLHVKTIEFGPEKTLKINPSLSALEEEKLCNILRENLESFAWSYKEMMGVHPSVCTHHIYIKEGCKPVRQPRRRMNPALKDIVKEELQKLLDTGFIYPISESEWVSPLVLVPNKNGKWRICVDYRKLNKSTKKDHFPLPFIDQVLDGLARKNFFSFLDGVNGYNQIKICP
eukprot:PITA_26388